MAFICWDSTCPTSYLDLSEAGIEAAALDEAGRVNQFYD